MGKIIKDTIHANGIDIGIYTQDFENEFISLTDIARYKSDDPTAVIQNWMRNSGRYAFMVKNEWRKESILCREARSKRGNTGRSL